MLLISDNAMSGINNQRSGGTFLGNKIRTNITGIVAIPNDDYRIFMSINSDNIIVGTGINESNLISGNKKMGILINGDRNKVINNKIGVDISGTSKIPNEGIGVYFAGEYNEIGDGTAAGRNIISGNASNGVTFQGGGTEYSTILNNYIGVDITGLNPLGNDLSGIVSQGSFVTIKDNVISANGGSGISTNGVNEFIIQGNNIGVDANGENDLGNLSSGLAGSHNGSTIGGRGTGEPNIIVNNDVSGIYLFSGVDNQVISNSIYNNGNLGISWAFLVPTTNDNLDLDTGTNNRQNYPIIDTSCYEVNNLNVQGSFNSEANKSYYVELFKNESTVTGSIDPSDFGEGQELLGSVIITTDGNGDASFIFTHSTMVSMGDYILSTATECTRRPSGCRRMDKRYKLY